MAQAEQAALRKMTAAETKLKVAVKDLNDKCDGDNGVNPSELWVTRKIATLANYWTGFENAHTSYVELLDLEASVEAFEHFGVVTQLHDDVVEKGKALIDSRQAPTPRRATIQEQYDVAAHERQTTFEEVEGIVAEVVSHVEEKGEETPASLQRQKEKLARQRSCSRSPTCLPQPWQSSSLSTARETLGQTGSRRLRSWELSASKWMP